MWHQLLDAPESYLESSCTGMFVFALATGVERGWLPARNTSPLRCAGGPRSPGYVDEKGDSRMLRCCLVRLVRRDRQRIRANITVARPKKTGDLHGSAAFLWAATAMPPAGESGTITGKKARLVNLTNPAKTIKMVLNRYLKESLMRRVNVIGVGMTKFTTPQGQGPLYQHGPGGRPGRAQGRGDRLQGNRTGLYWLGVWGQLRGRARGLRPGPHRGVPIFNLTTNCSDRLETLCTWPGWRSGPAWSSAPWPSVRADVARGSRSGLQRRPNPMEKFFHDPDEDAEILLSAPPARRRCSGGRRRGITQAKWGRQERNLRQDFGQARKHAEHNERAVFRNLLTHARTVTEVAHIFGPLRIHRVPVLPADLRGRGGGGVLGRVRGQAQYFQPGLYCRLRPWSPTLKVHSPTAA